MSLVVRVTGTPVSGVGLGDSGVGLGDSGVGLGGSNWSGKTMILVYTKATPSPTTEWGHQAGEAKRRGMVEYKSRWCIPLRNVTGYFPRASGLVGSGK